ncbi:hypothetical protein C463_11920 [Halorubrum californiense DSM 19288]|uniref:SPW repeat protein n=1 Tax=Halorubrum californiense DSM 19288 TaxID=1227465 RepID=M0E4L1_9EURY|nr:MULTISPECIES: hypothetical protein [Halorubrum]ELZ41973.1 hypothetical protein C463_11920 [Halorubrum californiense DSM 19288]TKX66583.1 hypothetical protein EXE40_15765 [Halorubrum sp. GN11GM_10-3_MGM]
MSSYQNQRRLYALSGAFLTAVAAAVAVLLGGGLLAASVLTIQVLMIVLAGICDLVAATGGLGGWAWYRWGGLGNILLGLSLPLGFVGTSWDSIFLLVTGLGGLSLTAMGIDLVAFHGRYTKQTPLDERNQ